MTESLNIILMSNDSNDSVGVIQNTEVNAALQHAASVPQELRTDRSSLK